MPNPSIRSRLVGTWRLISTEQRMRDGSVKPSPIYGPNGTGYLMYGDTGRMCAILVNPDRPLWKDDDAPTPEELKSAVAGFIAYYGAYTVDESESAVVHHVEAHLVPNWVGDQTRKVALSGNQLTLRPAPPLPEGVVEYKLLWERV